MKNQSTVRYRTCQLRLTPDAWVPLGDVTTALVAATFLRSPDVHQIPDRKLHVNFSEKLYLHLKEVEQRDERMQFHDRKPKL